MFKGWKRSQKNDEKTNSELHPVSSKELIRLVREGLRGSHLDEKGEKAENANELYVLLKELEELISQNETISRQIEISQRIIQLDDIHQKFSKYTRALMHLILAYSLNELARQHSSLEAQQLLTKAIENYDAALAGISKRNQPGIWAQAQKDKGYAFLSLGGIDEAVIACFDAALTIYTPQKTPDIWATLQHNKGALLFGLATFSSSYSPPAKMKALREAAECFSNETLVYTSQTDPAKWAQATLNKGDTLYQLSRMLVGTEQANLLQASLDCFDEVSDYFNPASTISNPEKTPDKWAHLQFMKGTAIYDFAGFLEGTQRIMAIMRAVNCYDEALKFYSREKEPKDWALTQHFKGKALMTPGWFKLRSEYGGGTRGRLREALACFDSALSVFHKETDPQLWAEIQDWKGGALHRQALEEDEDTWHGAGSIFGNRLSDEERITLDREAIKCYDAALTVRAREANPLAWAGLQNNKGFAFYSMSRLFDAAERMELLRAAIDCFDNAMDELRHEMDSSHWAGANRGKQQALKDLTELQEQATHSEAQLDAIELGPMTEAVLVRQLNFEELGLVGQPGPSYTAHPDFIKARSELRDVIHATSNKQIGLIIFGKPNSGKTHLALEVLRLEAPEFFFVFWLPSIFAPPPSSLRLLRGQRVVFFLENLEEFARQEEASIIQEAISRLKKVCKQLIVVATASEGTKEELITKGFSTLLDQLAQVTIKPMILTDQEADKLLEQMELVGRISDRTDLGTGRVFAAGDLERRTAQLLDPAFPSDALAILKSLYLLRSINVFFYPEERVRRVACGVFGLPTRRRIWSTALSWLLEEGWLKQVMEGEEKQSVLRMHQDAYLEVAMASIYPGTGESLEKDFSKLFKSLGSPPIDAEVLFSLSDALEKSLEAVQQEDQAARCDMMFACLKLGLSSLDPARQSYAWAERKAILGDRYYRYTKNYEAAIEAFTAALSVFTRESFLENWARLQMALSLVYLNLQSGDKRANYKNALIACNAALTVFTRESFPIEWATVQRRLGRAYVRLAELDYDKSLGAPIAEDYSSLVNQPLSKERTGSLSTSGDKAGKLDSNENYSAAVQAYQAALLIFTRNSYPEEWAQIQRELGFLYFQSERLNSAIEAFNAALSVITPEASPEVWASTQAAIGMAYSSTDEVNFQAALIAFNAALTVFTRESFPREWAITQKKICEVYIGSLSTAETSKFQMREGVEVDAKAAISSCEAALSFFSRESHPEDWAQLQMYLGTLYQTMQGKDSTYLMKAIQAYTAALQVFSQESHPYDWAGCQYLLGLELLAYGESIEDDSNAVINESIKALEAALTIFTRESSPEEWGDAQLRLGQAYIKYAGTDNSVYLEKALKALEAALTVFSRESSPEEWALANFYLAVCFLQRDHGESIANLDGAVSACNNALSVFTFQVNPELWMALMNMLGTAQAAIAEEAQLRDDTIECLKWRSLALESFNSLLPVVKDQQLLSDLGEKISFLEELSEIPSEG